ncbi:hypothetical protein MLD38_006255 [Melastoma candidum]|uniref:Uncharacterized protein n=1 Tax=Melastoma candidum TaxID=119954 RepID=A0ACB9RMA6_9MYRT|nr:hypothetical protein MLD38_006255 [Melastoma candidum]
MRSYTEAIDEDMWNIVENGLSSTPIENRLDSQRHPTREFHRLMRLNSMSKYLLFNAMSPSEFAKVSTCNTAQEIIEKLVTMYVGTIQIRETKMNILVHQHENFSMKRDEIV